MSTTKILIVDDSIVARRLISEAVESDPALEVVGTAPNGRIGVDKITRLGPDLIILDVEMPVMSGLEALAAIRRAHPRLPVIMCSSVTEAGAKVTLEALSLGASDCVAKPSQTGSKEEATARIRQDLVPKIKALCGLGQQPPRLSALRRHVRPAPAPRLGRSPRPASSGVDIIAIGSSTGGPNALAAIIAKLPGAMAVPIVIVQHMPEVFTRLLAERLDAASPLHVREARGGEVLRPGDVWIAPGGYHLVVKRSGTDVTLQTNQEPPENFCRPAVDVLFRSVAGTYQDRSLAVVLTGMGQDGMLGCETIRAAAGRVVVQDEESSVVWGMPGAVVGADLEDAIVPLDQMAEQLIHEMEKGRTSPTNSAMLDCR